MADMFLMKALLLIHFRYPYCVGVDLDYFFTTAIASECASGDQPLNYVYY